MQLLGLCGRAELQRALLVVGERLEGEGALGLLAQRPQLKVVGGVQGGADGDVVLDHLQKLRRWRGRVAAWPVESELMRTAARMGRAVRGEIGCATGGQRCCAGGVLWASGVGRP